MNESPVVSYAAFESMVTAYEKHVRRLMVTLLIVVVMLFLSNLAWLHFFSQFEYVEEEYSDVYTQDGYGNNNINTGEQGGVRYGADLSQDLSQTDDDAQEQ